MMLGDARCAMRRLRDYARLIIITRSLARDGELSNGSAPAYFQIEAAYGGRRQQRVCSAFSRRKVGMYWRHGAMMKRR